MTNTKENFLEIKKAWCKKCGICVEFCPTGVFKPDKEGFPEPVYIDKCTQCRMCITLCPDYCIFTDPKTKKDFEER